MASSFKLQAVWLVACSLWLVARCLPAPIPGEKVAQQLQAVGVAFLGVELYRENIIPRHRAGKGYSVLRLAGNDIPRRRPCVEAVHKIESRGIVNPAPKGM